MVKKKSKTSTTKAVAATQNSDPDLQEFNGFKALPVLVAKNCRHYIYIKKHETRITTDNTSDRSLFVLNLPVDTTDSHLQELFNQYGQIESVQYPGNKLPNSEEEEPKKKKKYRTKKQQQEDEEAERQQKAVHLRRIFESGSFAHVVFKSSEDLERVLDMPHQDKKWKAETKQQPLGLKRYIRQYNIERPDHDQLQQQVNAFMLKFTASEYEKEREAQERLNKMDDDGFTVVSRVRKGIASATQQQPIEQPKKKKMGDLNDFYRFQLRQQKQNELQQLRERFEQDKQKIEQQKQSRRFKPY